MDLITKKFTDVWIFTIFEKKKKTELTNVKVEASCFKMTPSGSFFYEVTSLNYPQCFIVVGTVMLFTVLTVLS